MNLHGIVRGAITVVSPDELVTHIRAVGVSPDDYDTDEEGNVIGSFEVTKNLRAQIQTETDSALFFSDHTAKNEVVRRCYLFASKDMAKRPFTAYRQLARSGDFLKRSDGTYWLVTAVIDDFGENGWVCLRITLQIEPPKGYKESEGD